MGAPNTSVAIVTGASRGIGRAIALELGRQSFTVIVNYRRDAAAAAEVVAEIEQGGGVAQAVAADISDLESHARLVDAAAQQAGELRVLVNNAGITSPGRKDLLEVAPASWDEVMATNLRGPFFLSQRLARHFELTAATRSETAYLINISSISAYTISTSRGDYCLAKAGVHMMTGLFAARLAEHNVRVYEICPGIIRSDMTAPVQAKYDALIADGLTPLRRWGTPADVARAVGCVVNGSLPFSTGEQINVDGGFHLRRL